MILLSRVHQPHKCSGAAPQDSSFRLRAVRTRLFSISYPAVQLIIHIWNQWESAWAERNQALHGNTATEKSKAIWQEVRRQLDIIYQNRHLLEPSVQELLCDQQEEHERQNPIVTRNWLAQNARLFKDSIRRARQRATRNVRSIRSYFKTASGG